MAVLTFTKVERDFQKLILHQNFPEGSVHKKIPHSVGFPTDHYEHFVEKGDSSNSESKHLLQKI